MQQQKAATTRRARETKEEDGIIRAWGQKLEPKMICFNGAETMGDSALARDVA